MEVDRLRDQTVYFAHPIKSYGTRYAEYILRALRTEFSEVINPRDFPPPEKPGGCKNCMQKVMKEHFFPMIEKCENFAIWAFNYSCGIECELHYAAQLGKKLFRIEFEYDLEEIDFEEITLQEYHLLRRVTNVPVR